MKARFAALAAASLMLASCDDTAAPPGETPVASVQIDRDSVTMQPADTLRLTATVRDSQGAPLTRPVTWTSTNAGAAMVSTTGLVTASPGGGTALIIAQAEGESDSAVVQVPGAVATVELDVDTAQLAEGAQRQFVATARDAQGLVITGRAVIWSSSDPGVTHVDALGLATAIRPGTTEVRARVDGDTGRAAVIVSATYDFDLVYAGWSGTAGEWPRLNMVDINSPDRTGVELSAVVGAGDYAVSPDGSQYVVAGNVGAVRGLYLVDRDGSNPQLLLADSVASQPTWSPDGAKIAFRRWPIGEGADIWIMNANGDSLVNLTADHGATSQHTPTFSPLLAGDTYRIAYSHSPGPTAHLWTMDPDGTDKVQVTTGDVWDDWPSWSPDGTRLAYQRSSAGVFADIWVVAPGGTGAASFVSLPLSQFAPQWSPDGVLLAFASRGDAGHYEIFTVRANGSRMAQRTADALDKQEPVWVKRQ